MILRQETMIKRIAHGGGCRAWCLVVMHLLVVAFFCFNEAPRLTTPSNDIFDEHYFISSSRALIAGEGYKYLNQYTAHPPAGTVVMAESIRYVGDSTNGWRLPGLVCSAFILLILPFLALRIGLSYTSGIFATAILSLDGLFLSQGPIGMFNAEMLCFILLSLLIASETLSVPAGTDRMVKFRPVLAGIALGIATSFRWPAAYFLPLNLAVVGGGPTVFTKYGYKRAISRSLVFLIGWVGAYCLTFCVVWWCYENTQTLGFFAFHRDILEAEFSFVCNHRYLSRWWQWVLNIRPVWYHFRPPSVDGDPQTVEGIVALGNPVFFFVSVLSVIVICVKGLISRHFGFHSWVLVLGLVLAILPWAILPTPQYFHYFYPALPFYALSIAVAVELCTLSASKRVFLCLAFLICEGALFYYFSPIYFGREISVESWKKMMWLSSWI